MGNDHHRQKLQDKEEPKILHRPTGDYSVQDLPVPAVYGDFKALKTYLSDSNVTTRLAVLLQSDEDTARSMLSKAMAVVENAEDPGMLLKCDPRSIVTAVYAAHQVGLSIDARNHAYLVPRKNNKKGGIIEAKMMPGYKGYLYKLAEALKDFDYHVGVVYPADTFKISKSGNRETYDLEVADPWTTNYGNYKGAYCFFSWTIAGEPHSAVTLMPAEEIAKARESATTQAVWNKWTLPQIYKTVIKRASSARFAMIIGALDALDNVHFQGEAETPDMPKAREQVRRGTAADIERRLDEDEQKARGQVTDAEYTEIPEGTDGSDAVVTGEQRRPTECDEGTAPPDVVESPSEAASQSAAPAGDPNKGRTFSAPPPVDEEEEISLAVDRDFWLEHFGCEGEVLEAIIKAHGPVVRNVRAALEVFGIVPPAADVTEDAIAADRREALEQVSRETPFEAKALAYDESESLENVDKWDGETIYTSPTTVAKKDFDNARGGGQYLISIMSNRKKRASRVLLRGLNMPLIRALVEARNMKELEEIALLCTQGDEDVALEEAINGRK